MEARPHTAGNMAAGSLAAGSEVAASEVAGTDAGGSVASGSEVAGTEVAGNEPAGCEVTGIEMTSAGTGVDETFKAAVDAEWTPGPDGLLRRDAARVVIFDSEGRTFLIRGHDIDDREHYWWFTVGGGIAPGEDRCAGACRELAEETGLRVGPERLEGPVLRRSAAFHFVRETRRQDEEFFILRLDAEEAASLGSGRELTALEQEVLDEFRWWPVADLAGLAAAESLYPLGLAELAQSWVDGWDGSCPHTVEP